MNFLSKRIFGVSFVLHLLMTVPCVQAIQLLDKTIAIVNNVPITEKEVDERIAWIKRYQPEEKAPSRASIVEILMMDELIVQMAERTGIGLNSPEINQMAEEAIRSQAVPPELANDREKLKKQLIINFLKQGMLNTSSLDISEEEITEQMKSLPNQPQQAAAVRYHLETLLIPIKPQRNTTSIGWKIANIWPWKRHPHDENNQLQSSQEIEKIRQQAEQVLIKAKTGLSFKQLVAENKEQSTWKIEDIWRTTDKLPAAYINALTDLKPQEVAGPFQFYNGFHLIRLQEVSGPTVAQVRHILLNTATESDAQKIQQRLQEIRQNCLLNEADFQKQAQQHSEDPETVFKGGDLGWVLSNTLDKSFAEALETLNPGDISLPFETSKGWHIVQLVKKQFLTKDHPEWQRYVAKKLVERRKMIETIEKIQKEIYASAHIQWIDPTLQKTEKK